jgi:hypothetical protein
MCLTDFADLYDRLCDAIEEYINDVDFEDASYEAKQKIFDSIILNTLRVHKGEKPE